MLYCKYCWFKMNLMFAFLFLFLLVIQTWILPKVVVVWACSSLPISPPSFCSWKAIVATNSAFLLNPFLLPSSLCSNSCYWSKMNLLFIFLFLLLLVVQIWLMFFSPSSSSSSEQLLLLAIQASSFKSFLFVFMNNYY